MGFQDLYSLNFFTSNNALGQEGLLQSLGPGVVTEKCETYDGLDWKETEPLLRARCGHAAVTLDDFELNYKEF